MDSGGPGRRQARPKARWPMPFLSSFWCSSTIPCDRDGSMRLSWNGRNGNRAENYRAGGARGEVARESSTERVRGVAKTSSRPKTGTTASVKARVATAEPAVEQSWHGWEPAGPEFRSAQKWNCAARKIIPSSSAQKRSLLGLTDILVLRRSLGWNGCGVKQRDRVGVHFMHRSQ
jgi:hypothetical protein